MGEQMGNLSRPAPPNIQEPGLPELRVYPGIGRLGYFLGSLGINVLSALVTTAGIPLVGPLLAIALMFSLTISRLHNIGMSGAWSLLLLVPVANLLLSVRCLIGPAGYAQTKKLDTAGKVILAIILSLLGLAITALLLLLRFLYS